jgi:hypothetical protein
MHNNSGANEGITTGVDQPCWHKQCVTSCQRQLTTWQEVEGISLLVPLGILHNDGMTSIIPSRAPRADIRIGGEDIDQFTLPFVSPLGSEAKPY